LIKTRFIFSVNVERPMASRLGAEMRYRFENCLLDTDLCELRRDGVLRPIEPQVFDLLEYLIRNREHVVSRDDIFKAVWHGRLVSDGALSTRVNAARHAIADTGVEQRLIRTVRGKGFRFVGVISENKKTVNSASKFATEDQKFPSTFLNRPTIAVLPFVNLNIDQEQDALAAGMAEELITAFSKIDWLFVVSRNSSFAYKDKGLETRQITRNLGIRYVVEGSVRQVAGEMRITVRLLDGVADYQLWAEHYDRDAEQFSAFEDKLIANRGRDRPSSVCRRTRSHRKHDS
jgi:TolB-like protein